MTVPKNMRPLKSEEVDNLSTSIQSMVSRVDEKKSVLMRLLTELVQQYVFDSRKTSIERNIKIVNKIVEKNAKNIQLAFQDGITENMISDVVESATKGRTSSNEIRKNLSKLVKDSIEKKLVSDSDEKQIFKIGKEGEIIATSAVSSLSSSFLKGLNSYVSSSIRTKVRSTIHTQLSNKLKVTGTIRNNVGVKVTLSKYGTIASNLVRGRYKLNPSVFKKDTKDKISTTRITKSSDQIGVFKNLMGKVFSHQNKEVKTTISSVLEKGTTKILVFFFGPIGFLAVGAFKLLTTLTKIGTFILKTALKTVGFVIKGVSKAVGGIFRGLKALATSTVKLIGKTISLIYSTMKWSIQKMLPLIKTPAGMFILGYIAGFFYKHVILRLLPKGSIGELTKRIVDMVWGVYLNTKTRILGAMSEGLAKVSDTASDIMSKINIDSVRNVVEKYKNFLRRNDISSSLETIDKFGYFFEDYLLPTLNFVKDTIIVTTASIAGASVGTKIGLWVGSVIPGLGTIGGGVLGGLIGSVVASLSAESFLSTFPKDKEEKKLKVQKYQRMVGAYSSNDISLGSILPAVAPRSVQTAGKVNIDGSEVDAGEYYKSIQMEASELDKDMGISMSEEDANFVSNIAHAIDSEFDDMDMDVFKNRGIGKDGFADPNCDAQKSVKSKTFLSINPDDYKTGDYSKYSTSFDWKGEVPRNDYVLLKLMRAIKAREMLTNVKAGRMTVPQFRNALMAYASTLPSSMIKTIESMDDRIKNAKIQESTLQNYRGRAIPTVSLYDPDQEVKSLQDMFIRASDIDTKESENEISAINKYMMENYGNILGSLKKEGITVPAEMEYEYRSMCAAYLRQMFYQGKLDGNHNDDINRTLAGFIRRRRGIESKHLKIETAVGQKIKSTGSARGDSLVGHVNDTISKLNDVSQKLNDMKVKVSQQAMDRQIRLAKEKQALRDKKNKEKLVENTAQEAGSMKKSIRKMVDEKKNQKSAPSVTIIGSGEKDHDPDAE